MILRTCIETEVMSKINKFFVCDSFSINHSSPFRHSCMALTMKEKDFLIRRTVLLNLNLCEIIKKIVAKVSAHFMNPAFLINLM